MNHKEIRNLLVLTGVEALFITALSSCSGDKTAEVNPQKTSIPSPTPIVDIYKTSVPANILTPKKSEITPAVKTENFTDYAKLAPGVGINYLEYLISKYHTSDDDYQSEIVENEKIKEFKGVEPRIKDLDKGVEFWWMSRKYFGNSGAYITVGEAKIKSIKSTLLNVVPVTPADRENGIDWRGVVNIAFIDQYRMGILRNKKIPETVTYQYGVNRWLFGNITDPSKYRYLNLGEYPRPNIPFSSWEDNNLNINLIASKTHPGLIAAYPPITLTDNAYWGINQPPTMSPIKNSSAEIDFQGILYCPNCDEILAANEEIIVKK